MATPSDSGAYTLEKLQKASEAVYVHASKALLKPNPRLDNAVTNSRKHNLPPIAISPLQGQYLALQCQLMNAKSVLEVGTLGGYSTIWLASTGAKVTSIEIDPARRDIARENVAGLDVEIMLGAALDVLPGLHAQGKKFDFIFLDADWDEQWDYFQWALRLLAPNGVVYIDNVVRQFLESEFADGGESLLTKIAKLDNVTAALVGTLFGDRQPEDLYDGFLLATFKKE